MEEIIHVPNEKAILVGCQLPRQSDERFFYSMEELQSLIKTANGTAVVTVTQKRERYDASTFIGKGKIEEIKALQEELEADIIVFNDELTPAQNRNLSRFFDVLVIDRTQLILDIFATRAQSREGKLQVELAQLQYLLPRLSGMGVSLSRLGAGIGTRGPGETKLEKDRRHIRSRITEIKHQLQDIVHHRDRYRERRKENQSIQVALVGYTNAGKSTLFNGLTEADSYEENLLFATLDPLTRKMKLPSGFQVLVSDTVGFIQDLPTSLIAAFRSTLEEAKEADLLLHVVDGSALDREQHEQTVHSILKELKASHLPMVTLYNKRDKGTGPFVPPEAFAISAINEQDIKKVKQLLEEKLKEQLHYYHIYVSASDGRKLALLRSHTLLTYQQFDEESGSYECKGYAPSSMKLH
ncbi:GTP-binding proten HflX [Fictibacillus macauensis ZFHKF-1]|uniref:GTPase HflX n=1 Tax=Fictibacillus macauensis ZFHKF-1 TaxID=1196324 RepID=I8UJ26_9BACL|nr:GTPase HflX [Fictibacillus macauensis]EIT86890.1 GTP-binding proten HflX [Fictibacillus macauensis ZFHKF-1]